MEALALGDGFEREANLDAAVQRCVRGGGQGVRHGRMAHQPDGEKVARVEGEVQEGGEVAEELGRQVLRLVDDPHRSDLTGVDELLNALLDEAPALRAAIARLQPTWPGTA